MSPAAHQRRRLGCVKYMCQLWIVAAASMCGACQQQCVLEGGLRAAAVVYM
jgi:hypothetical protein